MKININSNKELVESIKQALKDNNGYCPCKLERIDDNKCPCKEFRTEIKSGECHCGLYIKEQE